MRVEKGTASELLDHLPQLRVRARRENNPGRPLPLRSRVVLLHALQQRLDVWGLVGVQREVRLGLNGRCPLLLALRKPLPLRTLPREGGTQQREGLARSRRRLKQGVGARLQRPHGSGHEPSLGRERGVRGWKKHVQTAHLENLGPVRRLLPHGGSHAGRSGPALQLGPSRTARPRGRQRAAMARAAAAVQSIPIVWRQRESQGVIGCARPNGRLRLGLSIFCV
mmetsp:Transcript_16810/g.63740  ORF Transcript_16810/g.63740 Transcript_16810/m.63740 type:complete len:224 (-) Transcript_16810:210-881(-)